MQTGRRRKLAAVLPPGPLERAAVQKRRDKLISEDPELTQRLRTQLDAAEITESDFWWLLGEESHDEPK